MLQPRTGSSHRAGTARLTRSSEPIFLPKTCCGWWVRTESIASKTGPGFSRAAESAPDAARAAALYRYLFRISGRADSTVLYEEERTLPGALGDVSGLACVTAVSPEKRRDATDIAASSAATPGHSPSPGSGILTRFPFDGRPAARPLLASSSFCCFRGQQTRPTDPCSTAVGTEPFSTSVFEGLVRIFATTTKICTCGGSTRARALGFKAHRSGPPTRRGIGQARASFSSAQALLAATVRHRSVAQRHPFSGPVDSAGTLAGRLVHPTAPVLLTKSGPLGTRIRFCRRRDDEGGREVGRLRIRESRPVPPVPSSRVGRGRERPRGLQSYPEGNFGGNQLLDGSIGLSPLHPVPTIDLHVRGASDFHQSFLWLHPDRAWIAIFRVPGRSLRQSRPSLQAAGSHRWAVGGKFEAAPRRERTPVSFPPATSARAPCVISRRRENRGGTDTGRTEEKRENERRDEDGKRRRNRARLGRRKEARNSPPEPLSPRHLSQNRCPPTRSLAFAAPSGFFGAPTTRERPGLLGPCFKTGRVGCRCTSRTRGDGRHSETPTYRAGSALPRAQILASGRGEDDATRRRRAPARESTIDYPLLRIYVGVTSSFKFVTLSPEVSLSWL
ncbi:unnamed protein product [Acanthosepion pharaonis]|uniref:Uncharacterized protein n=1 Tax=Acanthosepion pharaonis TaxID=158019 RepID=A0A812C1B4_ACAPH|nr:unnamed protein product [Sepia pharaonis]